METLKEKIRLLEEEFGRDKQGGDQDLACRINELEETVDRHKFQMEMEVRGVYRDVGGLCQNFGILQGGLQRWTKHYDDKLEALLDANFSSKSDLANVERRLIDLDDASMKLEDRVENLEAVRQTVLSRRRKASTPTAPDEHAEESSESIPTSKSGSESWTVHVSLLPTASIPMPFEKDTIAYKRCLSRGLHRMLAIPGRDAESFNKAISDAFHAFLRGRAWMPLVAKLCDVVPLLGLPMLRLLPKDDIDVTKYNYQWLSKNCATCAKDGKIADLYIAMIDESLTWTEISRAPIFLQDLEACWQYDSKLDKPPRKSDDACEVVLEDEASAGDIFNVIRSKRANSTLSRKSSFGSGEGEILAKRARLNNTESVDRLRQMTEAI